MKRAKKDPRDSRSLLEPRVGGIVEGSCALGCSRCCCSWQDEWRIVADEFEIDDFPIRGCGVRVIPDVVVVDDIDDDDGSGGAHDDGIKMWIGARAQTH